MGGLWGRGVGGVGGGDEGVRESLLHVLEPGPQVFTLRHFPLRDITSTLPSHLLVSYHTIAQLHPPPPPIPSLLGQESTSALHITYFLGIFICIAMTDILISFSASVLAPDSFPAIISAASSRETDTAPLPPLLVPLPLPPFPPPFPSDASRKLEGMEPWGWTGLRDGVGVRVARVKRYNGGVFQGKRVGRSK
eukprot:707366-Hanusia_phi.AAC.2